MGTGGTPAVRSPQTYRAFGAAIALSKIAEFDQCAARVRFYVVFIPRKGRFTLEAPKLFKEREGDASQLNRLSSIS